MKKFLGFYFQNGDLTNEKTGEVILWGNIYFRIASDEDLEPGEFGCKVADIKVKASYVAKSLGFKELKLDDDKMVTDFLAKLNSCIGKNIDFILTLVKGNYTITGFKIVS
ncbi:MAG: hypothetical protein IKJ59_14295 [Clostridia bacterium]|nr:hypothetical protein [Clostridia bacterium]